MNKFIRVMVGVFIFAGCADPGEPLNKTPAVTAIGEPMGATVTTMIGPSGGTVRAANGELELIIPAGALSTTTAMTVTPLSVTCPGGVKQFRLGPEGTTFSTPATVKMTLTEQEANGAPQEGWRIAFQTPDRRWSVVPDKTIEGRTVSVQTTHLSDWSLNLGFNLFPDLAVVQAGSTITLTPRLCSFDRQDPMSPILDCQDKGLDRFFVNWSVNGIPGGNSTFGTVQGTTMTRTYTAPSVRPDGPVNVSVDWVPPPDPGFENTRIVLVSTFIISDRAPTLFTGEMNFHLKKGGPGTSILPLEYRVSAPVRFEIDSNGVYDLKEGPATLVSYSKQNGVANCTCSASNVQGTVQSNTGALILGADSVTNLEVSALFTLNLVCTGSTDPACSNTVDFLLAPWALTGQHADCQNTSKTTFTEPTHVNGSWETNCPMNPQLVGRYETASWMLTGNL